MSARRPLHPLSPLSANVAGAQTTYITKIAAHDDAHATMYKQARDDNTQGSGSIVSGLTSLENEAEDDFERLMIQNERDERRLHAALRGNVQPFRKARSHPNVALTLENLARNNARHGDAAASAHVDFESPSSSSGSVPSDPAMRPPAQWGRKGRPRRDWLRTITAEEEQAPGAPGDTIERMAVDETPRQVLRTADAPLPSVEDSPLSHKSLPRGTPSTAPRRQAPFDSDLDLDFTLDFNEASMIASTPYIPRNTRLDDIRQREIDSLKEQALTTNRLDRIRENSPEEKRRPTSSSSKRTPQVTASEQPAKVEASPEIGSRRRTNSWKTIGKSQAVTGETDERSPNSSIVVFKRSLEEVGVAEPASPASVQTSHPKRPTHRKEDSQELLRRLARVSSGTPSPGRVIASRPQTALAHQNLPSSRMTEAVETTTDEVPVSNDSVDTPQQAEGELAAELGPLSNDQQTDEPQKVESSIAPTSQPMSTNIDATPIPGETSILGAKTPVVTGAWVDTPGPRTIRRTVGEIPPVLAPKYASPNKRSAQKQKDSQSEEEEKATPIEPTRPTLPGSALEAIVEEARANGQSSRYRDEYGDSTIDSLEELIAPGGDVSGILDLDDDTLQGLQLPTEPPKNEKERIRQQELRDLYKMNQRLRAARTGIRDASRGIKRIEHHVEHVEENGQAINVVYRDCPCAAQGHKLSPWSSTWAGFKRLFYDPKLPRRAGLTWLSMAFIAIAVWFLTENAAW